MPFDILLRNIEPQGKSLQPLKYLVAELRKHRRKGLLELTKLLSEEPELRKRLSQYLLQTVKRYSGKELLTDSGINKNTTFISAFYSGIKHTLLPVVPAQHSLAYLLHIVFSEHKDADWVSEIQDDLWERFFTLLFQEEENQSHIFLSQAEVSEALEILSYRVTSEALDTDFAQRYSSLTPFYAAFKTQHRQVEELREVIEKNKPVTPDVTTPLIEQLQHCQHAIAELKRVSVHKGTSLEATFTLHRLEQQVLRMRLLANMLSGAAASVPHAVQLFKQLLLHEKEKNSLRKLLRENSYLLAYRIAEHESTTGEHYIAANEKEYYEFFKAASKGGVIAALMTFVKMILHHLHLAPFWEAFCYSLNYAGGFVTIQVSHSILATKQPAMTASTIAAALDKKSAEKPSIPDLAILIGSVSRSQFISFAGNLLLVFPTAFAIAALYYLITGTELANTTEALHMLQDVHPWNNPTWLYACITGVFLFISGIISGYYDNKVIYSSIPQRIRQHRVLRKWLTQRQLVRISRYVEYNLGSLIGNISLGFFLGTATFLGFIFGLPFDIRHITISSGNFAFALFTLMDQQQWMLLAQAFIGVMGVGFFNFLVSFGLALVVAAKSRKVGRNDFLELLRWVKQYIRRYPKDFVFPPRGNRQPSDIEVTRV